MKIDWENGVEEKFKQLIERVPLFLRDLAKDKVSKRIEHTLRDENRTDASEKDLADAFFTETPFGFHGPLKTDMEAVGIDYTQYGYDK